jgi:predicted AlkP superfamily phosphohydrolase/phosphomutase
MVRIVVIGIDGLDADLLRVYGPSLPNLRLLMLESPYLDLQSCFPPDPAPAWASIYTGQNPAQHGMLSLQSNRVARGQGERVARGQGERVARGQGERVARGQGEREDRGNFQAYSAELHMPAGDTFWDKASQAGKRVCCANVHFSSLLATPVSCTKRHLEQFCQSLRTHTEQQTDAGLELLRSEPWDIFFIQFHALDSIQRLLWRYSDPGDPTYPGKNEHAGRIRDCYALFDLVIGRFRAEMGDDSVLLVVSGYGYGRGCLYYLNLNEWLRAEGLLVAHPRYTRLFHARHRGDNVDVPATLAQVAMIALAPSFGGISLNRAAIQARRGVGNYEQVRNSIIQRLQHLRLNGRPVVHWAKTREQMYVGRYSDRYPDILFELRNEYGISTAVHVPLTTNNPRHGIASGTHRMQGVLLLGNLPDDIRIRETIDEPGVMDVAPTILALLGEPTIDGNCDGRALVDTISLLHSPL